MKRFSAFLLAFLLLFALFGCKKQPESAPPAPDESAPAAVLIANGRETRVSLAGLDGWALPDAPTLDGRVFVAWQQVGGGLYLAGETYDAPLPQSGEITFRALGVRFGALPETTPHVDTHTLEFSFSVDGADVRALAGAADLKIGLLLAPYASVTGGTRTFTVDSLAAGLQNFSLSPDLAADKDYTVSGATGTIADSEILEKFAARPYLSFCHGTRVEVVYGSYLPLVHTASLYGAAALSTEDLRDAASAAYPHAVTTDAGVYFSPLPAAEYAARRALLDKAVFVDSAAGRVESRFSLNNVDFSDFQYYRSPYRVDRVEEDAEAGTSTFVVVGADDPAAFADISAYYVGGSYRPPRSSEWRADGLYITISNRA